MKIVIADKAGFCFGVKRAVEIVEKTISENQDKKVFMFGQLIHNPQYLEHLKERGVVFIDDVSKAEEGILIMRAHGTMKNDVSKVKPDEILIVDTVCPFVKQIHDLTQRYEKEAYKVFIYGEKDHPEVQAIASYLEDPVIIEDPDDIEESVSCEKGLLVSQTTQNRELYTIVADQLKEYVKNLVIKNTICNATEERQSSAKSVAESVDMMIIIGGKNSGNTRRLHYVCAQIVDSVHIESAAELEKEMFKDINVVGITAGASTPDFAVNEVIDFLKKV